MCRGLLTPDLGYEDWYLGVCRVQYSLNLPFIYVNYTKLT